MNQKEHLKSRGWFRRILTLGRKTRIIEEKNNSKFHSTKEEETDKYHQRVHDWEACAEQARHTPDRVLEVVRQWISETSR